MNSFIKTVILKGSCVSKNGLKNTFNLCIFSILVLMSGQANALLVNPTHSYYGQEFYAELKDNKIRNDEILFRLKRILRGGHINNPGQYDQIFDNCTSRKGCYEHTAISYSRARVEIFGNLDLQNENGQYYVKEVYCNTPVKSGPNQIPPNTVANVEHTWPQSKFTRKYSEDTQKADLHHLFPTDSQLNSVRSSYHFGEVAAPKDKLKCTPSVFGYTAAGKRELVFQPPTEHRGNVARAIFYFTTRYDMNLDNDEEAFLRKWHHEDPVDQDERERNDKIFNIQKNRNPFVDHPELVEQVQAF